jgi:energy-coupling factor transporter ATP-binding protein EcfA2
MTGLEFVGLIASLVQIASLIDISFAGRLKSFASGEIKARKLAVEDAWRRASQDALLAFKDRSDEATRVLEAMDRLARQPDQDEFIKSVQQALFLSGKSTPALRTALKDRLKWDAFFSGEAHPPESGFALEVMRFSLSSFRDALVLKPEFAFLREIQNTNSQLEMLNILKGLPRHDESKYREAMHREHSRFKFTGLPRGLDEPDVEFKKLFIELRGKHIQETRTRFIPNEATLEADGKSPTGRTSLREPISADPFDPNNTDATSAENLVKAIHNHQKLVIIGNPGTGKSTLLKYLCAGHANGILTEDGQDSLLPIFVSLAGYARDGAGELINYISSQAKKLQLELPPEFFKDALSECRCIVCLDGLDEVWDADTRNTIRTQVEHFINANPGNTFVISSRIVGYRSASLDTDTYRHYRLVPLEKAEIEEYIQKWYEFRLTNHSEIQAATKQLLERIEASESIKSLARNPLLLRLICLVNRARANLPEERVKLYELCLELLLETWEEPIEGHKPDPNAAHFKHRRRLLERLAYSLHAEGKSRELRSVPEAQLEEMIEAFLMSEDVAELEDRHEARREAKLFMRLARERTGLLYEDGQGTYSFAHLSFQEYLTAQDIVSGNDKGTEGYWQVMQPILHRPHWSEVLLLLLGSVKEKEAKQLLSRIWEAGEQDEFEPVVHHHLFFVATALVNRVKASTELELKVFQALEKNVQLSKRENFSATRSLEIVEKLQRHPTLGSNCISYLEHLTTNGETGFLQYRAAVALITFGSEQGISFGRTGLINVSKDEKNDYLVEAITALIRLDSNNQSTIQRLRNLANNNKYIWQFRAVQALIQLEPDNENTLQALRKIVGSSSHLWQFRAVQVLIQLEPDSNNALQALHKIVKSNHSNVIEAITALIQLEPENQDTRQLLRDVATHVTKDIRQLQALQALIQFEPKNQVALDKLYVIANDTDCNYQFQALQFLIQLEPNNQSALQSLRKIAGNVTTLQLQAIQELIQLKPENSELPRLVLDSFKANSLPDHMRDTMSNVLRLHIENR